MAAHRPRPPRLQSFTVALTLALVIAIVAASNGRSLSNADYWDPQVVSHEISGESLATAPAPAPLADGTTAVRLRKLLSVSTFSHKRLGSIPVPSRLS